MIINGEFAPKWQKYFDICHVSGPRRSGVRTRFERVQMRSGKLGSLPNPEPNFRSVRAFGRSVRFPEPSMNISKVYQQFLTF